ncbi:MAG: hypothetical protein Q4F88_03615 [Eubacteriales bacterium]|nr:hypothetical protein [Eubacteriales bacterium]
MKKKYLILGSILLVVFIIITIFVLSMNKSDKETTEVNKKSISENDLEKLTVDDYKNNNIPNFEDFNFDDVDTFYYYGMRMNPGIYKENATRTEREKIYKYHFNLKEAILEMCKKNGDWILIINNDRVRAGNVDKQEKYFNQKNGLFEDFDYTEIESSDILGSDNYGKYVDIVAKNTSEKRKYRVRVHIEDGNIQSVNVKLGNVDILNNNTNMQTKKILFDDGHTKENFENLCRYNNAYVGGLEWDGDDIAISNNFKTKYKTFLDLFIHYSPLEYNKVTLLDLDINKKKVKFEVDSFLECKRRTYDVKYSLSSDLQLEEAQVELINEKDVDFDVFEKQSAYYIFKNSNLKKIEIPISNKFIEKYNERTGIFDLDVVNFDIDSVSISGTKVYIYKFLLKNRDIKWVGGIDILDENNKIDDFFIIDLLYNNISMEEAKERFLADTELQKELGIK